MIISSHTLVKLCEYLRNLDIRGNGKSNVTISKTDILGIDGRNKEHLLAGRSSGLNIGTLMYSVLLYKKNMFERGIT